MTSNLLSPLALASYVAWSAVWISSSALFGRSGFDGPWADLLTLGFLACWLWLLASEEDASKAVVFGVVGLMTGLALGLIALGPSGSTPILLILAATQLASRLTLRGTVFALAAVNAVYLLILLFIWNSSLANALIGLAAYGSFQMFAALVLSYARAAEDMAEELKLVNADLMATRTLLADSARDQERLRLSRELHDVAGHKLTALKMNLRALRNRADPKDRDALATADELAGELLDDLRAVVRQLRRNDGLSLEQGIRQLAAPLRGMQLHLDIAEDVRIERIVDAETLMRVAQEGLTNAIRHGKADQAWLRLEKQAESWALELEDNGRIHWPIVPGMGLKGMMERLESLDGQLDFHPSERGGLKLTARLPFEIAA